MNRRDVSPIPWVKELNILRIIDKYEAIEYTLTLRMTGYVIVAA